MQKGIQRIMAENDTEKTVRKGMLLFGPVIECAAYSLIDGQPPAGLVWRLVWSFLAAGLFLVYEQLFCEERLSKESIEKRWLVVGCVLISVPVAMLYGSMGNLALYLLGAVTVAAIADMGSGLMLVLCLSLIAAGHNGVDQEFLTVFVLGIVLCLLTQWLGGKESRICACVIGVALAAVLAACAVQFRIFGQPGVLVRYIGVTVGILFGAAVAMQSYRHLAQEPVPGTGTGQDDTITAGSANTSGIADTSGIENASGIVSEMIAATETAAALEPDMPAAVPEDGGWSVLSEDDLLLQRMREVSPKLWKHSLKIADFSGRAAEYIGANVKFCRLIALYHEIGKLEDKKDYPAAGERMMIEMGLPEELIQSVKQVTDKNAAIHNRETAIVVLTCNVLATLHFLKTHQENQAVSTAKVVENTFMVRLMKGNLDEAGLSIRDYSRLKKFFLLEFVFE